MDLVIFHDFGYLIGDFLCSGEDEIFSLAEIILSCLNWQEFSFVDRGGLLSPPIQ